MLRMFIPILVIIIIWVIALWQVYVQKKKFDLKGLTSFSLFLIGIWALIYWLIFTSN